MRTSISLSVAVHSPGSSEANMPCQDDSLASVTLIFVSYHVALEDSGRLRRHCRLKTLCSHDFVVRRAITDCAPITTAHSSAQPGSENLHELLPHRRATNDLSVHRTDRDGLHRQCPQLVRWPGQQRQKLGPIL